MKRLRWRHKTFLLICSSFLSSCGGSDLVGVSELAVGQCSTYTPAEQAKTQTAIEVVPCESPHSSEIFFVGTLAAGDQNLEQVKSMTDESCQSQFEEYVGISYDNSQLLIESLNPLPEDLKLAPETFVCLLLDRDGLKFDESLSDSKL